MSKLEEHIKATGKPIAVNGREFQSAGQAAKWIVEEEYDKDCIRVKATVSKELRRFLQDRRGSVIYGYVLSKIKDSK